MSTNFPEPVKWAIHLVDLVAPGQGFLIDTWIDRNWGNPPLIRHVAGDWNALAEKKIAPFINQLNSSVGKLGAEHWHGEAYSAYKNWMTELENDSLWTVRDLAYTVRDALYALAAALDKFQKTIIEICSHFAEVFGSVILAYVATKTGPIGMVIAGGVGGNIAYDAIKGLYKDLTDSIWKLQPEFNHAQSIMAKASEMNTKYKGGTGFAAPPFTSKAEPWTNW